MKGKIISSTPPFVELQTQYGIMKGRWFSDSALVGKEYNFEIDIDEIISLNKNLELSSVNEFSIYSLNNKIVIIGILEDYTEDNCLIFRLADSILLFEVSSTNVLTTNEYYKITVTTDMVKIVDINI